MSLAPAPPDARRDSRAAGSWSTHYRCEDLVAHARCYQPVPVAVVHPVDGESLAAVCEAMEAGIVDPLLVGPRALIAAAAEAAGGLDVSACRTVDAPSPAAAAALATHMARDGRVGAIMKGHLHTSTLLHPVLARGEGLRTAAWISHVFVLDVPGHAKPLLLSDAVVTIAPTLEQKASICRNAASVAGCLGIVLPRAAMLSATEEVDGAIPSTLEAAALSKMAERGQIRGCVVDGPMSMDVAVSPASAAAKGVASPVAGVADILIAPDLEAGNMVYKSLVHFAGADAAGVVVGAAVPIIVASRADSRRTRVASSALAAILAREGVQMVGRGEAGRYR